MTDRNNVSRKEAAFLWLWLFSVLFWLHVFIVTLTSSAAAIKHEDEPSPSPTAELRIIQTAATAEVSSFGDNECVFYLAEYVPIEKKADNRKIKLTSDERYMLARIVMAEAEAEDLTGKALVARVVINRIECETEFECTVEGVIFEEGQFSPVRPGCRYWKVEPNEDCYTAVDMVIDGWDESHGALYFEGCKSADNWHSRNLKYLFKHGTHRFYK